MQGNSIIKELKVVHVQGTKSKYVLEKLLKNQ